MASQDETAKRRSNRVGGSPQPAGAAIVAPAFGNGADESPVEVKTVVRPVQNAMAILRYLAEAGEPRTATQVARTLEINTSTCFNILRTLAGESMVNFDPSVKTYKLGIGVLKLASSVNSEESRLTAARPHLQDYAKRHHASVCVWRRVSPDRNVLVAIEYTPGNLRIHLQIGQGLPVLLGSTGRVMIPYLGLSKQQARADFRKLRWFDPPPFGEFWAQAQESKERGWATDDGNFSAGVLTVSTPVFDSGHNITYSLTALTFRDQHRQEWGSVEELGEDLVRLADTLRTILH